VVLSGDDESDEVASDIEIIISDNPRFHKASILIPWPLFDSFTGAQYEEWLTDPVNQSRFTPSPACIDQGDLSLQLKEGERWWTGYDSLNDAAEDLAPENLPLWVGSMQMAIDYFDREVRINFDRRVLGLPTLWAPYKGAWAPLYRERLRELRSRAKGKRRRSPTPMEDTQEERSDLRRSKRQKTPHTPWEQNT
jgi:hypothetical protein